MTEGLGTEAGRILRLGRYRAVKPERKLTELVAYWEALRAGRPAPRRSEIDPREFGDYLEDTFVLECAADGETRFRLAGMALCDMMGMELRGMPAVSVIAVGDRPAFEALVTQVLTTPLIATLHLSDKAGAPPTAQAVLLPLRDDFGAMNRVLGALVRRQAPIAVPQRLHLGETGKTRILADVGGMPAPRPDSQDRKGVDRPGPDRPRPAQTEFDPPAAIAAGPGFAEPAAGFEGPEGKRPRTNIRSVSGGKTGPGGRTRGKAPHLRLIKSED